jgi:hypothetical protein
MTDLRARLADALRQNGDLCTRANAEHLADVLLSLPAVIIADRKVLDQLRELHQPVVWNSAPFSRDGENDDLCCLTCDQLGNRHTLSTPTWPCATRELLDELLYAAAAPQPRDAADA